MSDHMQDEVSVRDIFLKIKEHVLYFSSKWKLFVLAGLIGGALGVATVYFTNTVYTASLNFALEDDKTPSSGGGGLSVLASQFGFDAGGSAGGAFSGQNLISLMKSRNVVEKTLLHAIVVNNETITLIEYYFRVNNQRDKWKEDPSLARLQFPVKQDRSTFTRLQDSVLGSVYERIISQKANNLVISQKDKKISIISIEVKAEDELFAKLFVESLAEEVSDFYVETKSQKSKLNLQILQRQTDSVRAELNSAISGVASATDNTYNLNPAYNVMRVPSSRRQIDVQANTAMLTQLVQNLELAKVTLRKETPLIQIIDRPILPLHKFKPSKRSAAIKGAIIAGLLTLLLLWLRRIWKKYT